MNVYNQSTGKITMQPDSPGGAGGAGSFGGTLAQGLNLFGKGLQAYAAYSATKAQASSLEDQSRAVYAQIGPLREQGVWDQERMNEEKRRTLSTYRQLAGQAGITLEGAPEGLMDRTRQEFLADRLQLAKNVQSQVQSLERQAWGLHKAARKASRQAGMNALGAFF